MEFLADIEHVVRELKVDRDTWQAVALQYKAAFEDQTRRLQELQDICVAAQAEVENERTRHRRQHATIGHSNNGHVPKDSTASCEDEPSFGTAIVFTPRSIDLDWHQGTTKIGTNPLYRHVQQLVEQWNYGTALAEIERLLRGPMSPKARAEGLLLKSNMLRAASPDELYDALAACSEAFELCGRLAELESFLPQVQYQRGLLYYELRMLHQAREAFSTVSGSDTLSTKASQYRRSCDDEIRIMKRRSGFDEHRTMSEELMVELVEKQETKRRRTSAQFRQRAAARAKRMSLPHRWA